MGVATLLKITVPVSRCAFRNYAEHIDKKFPLLGNDCLHTIDQQPAKVMLWFYIDHWHVREQQMLFLQRVQDWIMETEKKPIQVQPFLCDGPRVIDDVKALASVS